MSEYYLMPDEQRVQKEGTRLAEMYSSGTTLHILGKTLLRFVTQRSKMLKLLQQLTWLIEQAVPDLIENIAYQEACRLLVLLKYRREETESRAISDAAEDDGVEL